MDSHNQKQESYWDSLTPEERKREIRLTPEEIQAMHEDAKRSSEILRRLRQERKEGKRK